MEEIHLGVFPFVHGYNIKICLTDNKKILAGRIMTAIMLYCFVYSTHISFIDDGVT